ncbi:hypothetical protein vBValMR10Z_253 [Vibrio phage vB_ValM_R10Z]|uniref:Uncharacterized protein n=1 Tax=Vibrio phage phi-Grn1 TaxID=1747713 RepID=A0A126HH65_9CAUD|nr:hypothetical protein phiGrn1_0038 [Vibrio phage phi-Grn1]QNJ54793.1 hypothetical protein vBValMR10Z_253 [Vibrio phage vB_ValM_R10Z]QNJ55180.1 hypothetical protein vBValMR11Z_254 [Vibrio phage vB_ValM_R11Z]
MMLSHDELSKQINQREQIARKVLSEHYNGECEKEFTHAVENGAFFPIKIKVPIHISDCDKKGSGFIRAFFEQHGYRNLRTCYESGGYVSVEIFKNGTNISRHYR